MEKHSFALNLHKWEVTVSRPINGEGIIRKIIVISFIYIYTFLGVE
jgi:hypothetical protein